MMDLSSVADDARTLRDVYGRFPSGVIGICGLSGEEPLGMAVSAFIPVSLEPPLVSACIQITSTTWPQLRKLDVLGLSFLGEAHDKAARQLASKAGNRFEDTKWTSSESGAVFLDGAPAWLECSIDQEIIAGDHLIVLFKILRIKMDQKINPLVFYGSCFRQLVIE